MGNNNNILKQKPLLIAETYKNILLASTELYISMYVFDLKEGTLTALKTNEHITKLTENCSSLQEMVTNTMVNLSSPETVNTIRKFTDLSTLQERLKDKKVISELFHGKYNGWCNSIFIRIGEENPIRYVLYIVEDVDKQTRKIEEQKEAMKEFQKLHNIVDTLMSDYTSVCGVNYLTSEVEIYRMSKRITDIFSLTKRVPLFNDLVKMYVNNCVYETDKSDLRKILTKEFVIDNLSAGASYNKMFRNDLGDYWEMRIFRTSENYVLYGFAEKNHEIEAMYNNIYTDSLTGVKNRKFYDEQLAEESCQGLIIADIDYFKNINDTYGHKCGDAAIAGVAKALKSCLRKTDDVIRYGGDEFVIAFSTITLEALHELMGNMHLAVQKVKIEGYPHINLSMSFGAAYGDGQIEKMIFEADRALYESKKKRNTITIYDFNPVENDSMKLSLNKKKQCYL